MKKVLQILGIIALVFVIVAAIALIVNFPQFKDDTLTTTPLVENTSKQKSSRGTPEPVSVYTATQPKEYYIQNCIKVSAKELKRNPSEYNNKLVSVEGIISDNLLNLLRPDTYKYFYGLTQTDGAQLSIIDNYTTLKSSIPYKGDRVIFYGEFLYLNGVDEPTIRAYYIDFKD